jgi:hypothetical protein
MALRNPIVLTLILLTLFLSAYCHNAETKNNPNQLNENTSVKQEKIPELIFEPLPVQKSDFKNW